MARHGKKLIDRKRCGRCREVLPVSHFFPRLDGYLSSYCKPCNAAKGRDFRDSDVQSRLWSAARGRANQLGLPFDLEKTDIVVPTACPVFGIPIDPAYGKRSNSSPSVDRIVPVRGYVKGNVVVVSWRANRLKNNASLEELEALARFYRQAAA